MRYFIAAIVVALLVSPSWADTIKLTDGTVLRGKVKGKTAEKVIFEYERGKFKTIERSEIEAVETDDFEFPFPTESPKDAAPAKPPSKPVEDRGDAKKDASNGSQFKDQKFHAILENGSALDYKKVGKLVGRGPSLAQMVQVIMWAAGLFVEKEGEFNRDCDKEAFKGAFESITPGKIDTALCLIPETKAQIPKLFALALLVGASGEFVYAKGKLHLQAFDAALTNITMAKINKVKDLVKDKPGSSEPLYLLLRASAHFVNRDGKFDKDAFNAVLDALTADMIAAKMKEVEDIEGPNITAAFHLALRPAAP